MRFDVVFCSTELRGLNWVEFFDRVRGRVGAFALLAEAFSQDLSAHFRGEGRYVLHKPIEQSQFEKTLGDARQIDVRSEAERHAPVAARTGGIQPRGLLERSLGLLEIEAPHQPHALIEVTLGLRGRGRDGAVVSAEIVEQRCVRCSAGGFVHVRVARLRVGREGGGDGGRESECRENKDVNPIHALLFLKCRRKWQ